MSISDVGVRERISDLRRNAEIFAKEYPEIPEGARDYTDLADELEWQLNSYHEVRARVLEVANKHKSEREAELLDLRRKRASKEPMTFEDYDRLQYANLNKVIPDPAAMLEASRFGELSPQRLDVWVRELQAAGLLSPAEIRALDPVIPPWPKRLEEMRQHQQEVARLMKLREKILLKVEPGWPRREAETAWNVIGGYVDEAKIRQWVEACRKDHLLDDDWLPARRFGRWLYGVLFGKEEVNNAHFG